MKTGVLDGRWHVKSVFVVYDWSKKTAFSLLLNHKLATAHIDLSSSFFPTKQSTAMREFHVLQSATYMFFFCRR